MSNNQMNIPDKLQLFVYATLKRKHKLHSWLKGAKFLRTARFEGFTLYSVGAYPVAVREEGSFIDGEVYDMDEKSLKGVYWMEIGAGFTFLELLKKEKLFMFYYKLEDFEGLSFCDKIGSNWKGCE